MKAESSKVANRKNKERLASFFHVSITLHAKPIKELLILNKQGPEARKEHTHNQQLPLVGSSLPYPNTD
jgi:hypothetical protein